jgi:NitT/TauT family transport system substrate-binding protein
VWKFAQLVGNGIATNEATVQDNPELVRRFDRALLKGIADTIANPGEALQISAGAYPDIGGANLKTNQAVLDASVPLWQNARLGESNLADWQAMEKFMRDAGFIQADVDVTRAFTNAFTR